MYCNKFREKENCRKMPYGLKPTESFILITGRFYVFYNDRNSFSTMVNFMIQWAL